MYKKEIQNSSKDVVTKMQKKKILEERNMLF